MAKFNPYRMFQGIFIPECVLKFKGLNPIQKLIYGRLCRYAGENGECFPSIESLAEEIDSNERSVQEHLVVLEKQGFIARIVRPGKSNAFEFLEHECFSDAPKLGVRKSSPPEGTGGAEIRSTGGAEIRTHKRVSVRESEKNTPLPPLGGPEEKPKRPKASWYEEQHDSWWSSAYWCRKDKGASRKAYEKAINRIHDRERVGYNQARILLAQRALDDQKRFEHTDDWSWRIKLHAATWLNGSRWEDECSAAPPAASPAGTIYREWDPDAAQAAEEVLF